jgi:hypothetical protein
MRIELSIKADPGNGYVEDWGVWEGIREVVQNGKDAEKELDAPLTVRYRKDSGTLVVENEGCTLPYEAMLMGHSTKRGREDLIGKFGEGFNLGILALLRKGLNVKIRSGSEVWTPSIQKSEKFNAQVLVFDIEKGRKDQKRVAVEIGRMSENDWKTIQVLFLFLTKIPDDKIVKTASGSLLLGDEYKSRLFVKGIFVGNDVKLSYGYDFYSATLDRDRKMVEKYELQYRTQEVWRQAMATRPDLVDPFSKMLDDQAADVSGLSEYTAKSLPDSVKQKIVDEFLALHGPDALPVDSLAVSQEIGHLGKKGIICPKPMQNVLESVLGNAATNKAKLATEVVKLYGWHDLDDSEKAYLEDAIKTVNAVEPIDIDSIDVADFRNPKLLALYDNGRIQIAKHALSDRSSVLRRLVHEVAHRAGGDGEKGHVSNLERIWAGIVEKLRSN